MSQKYIILKVEDAKALAFFPESDKAKAWASDLRETEGFCIGAYDTEPNALIIDAATFGSKVRDAVKYAHRHDQDRDLDSPATSYDIHEAHLKYEEYVFPRLERAAGIKLDHMLDAALLPFKMEMISDQLQSALFDVVLTVFDEWLRDLSLRSTSGHYNLAILSVVATPACVEIHKSSELEALYAGELGIGFNLENTPLKESQHKTLTLRDLQKWTKEIK